MRTPTVELLWWEGCPSTERALADVRAALGELGLADAGVRMKEIKTDEEAHATGFPGSPTILIDGEDLVEPPSEDPATLTCRVYRHRDGRVSATPDPDDLREALRRAAERVEVNR